jgi:diguanylate cyclase (GGDEF)-like protein
VDSTPQKLTQYVGNGGAVRPPGNLIVRAYALKRRAPRVDQTTMRPLRVGRWSLLTKFTVLSLVCFAALGIALSQLLAHQIRDRALSSTVASAELLSGTIADSQLHASDMTGGMAAANARSIDAALAQAKAHNRVARFKIWNTAGRIVYSDDRAAIGKKYEVEDNLRGAFEGKTYSGISHGTTAEQQGERHLGTLLEAYVPLRFTANSKPVGAFEIYMPYGPVEAAAASDVRKLYALVAGGLTLLFLLLYRIVARASRSLRRQAEENRRQALHDALTELPNRRALYERLEQLVADGRPMALLVADLDGFKELNDTLGHHAGDRVLSQLGPRVAAAVPGTELLARIGGDEFAVLTTDPDPTAVAERFRAAVDEPFVVDGITLTVRASVGIARFPDHGDDAHALIQRADVAMYQAKARQSGWLEYESQRDEHSRTRLALAGELRRAISDGELVVHYQPKADLQRGEVISVEALVRWQHPDLGLLPPGEFVPMAEQTGQIRALTLYVLDAAAAQAREWEETGLDLKVAVNLAMANLIDSQLPDDVAVLLAKHRLAPSLLILEITENVVMADPARTLAILERLRSLGVGLSLDDFGTGHSSLAYLRQLQVDELKIDRSFVTDMVRDGQNAAIVRSTIDLAHAVGIRIVAEGVEDADTMFELKAMGADEMQGFYLSPAVPPAEIVAMLMHAFRPDRTAAS